MVTRFVFVISKRSEPGAGCKTDPDALARLGIGAGFAQALDVYNDGILVREIPLGGELVELVLTTQTRETSRIEDITDIPVIARDGSLKNWLFAEVSIESALNQLLRKAGRRVVTIELRLHESIPLKAIAEITKSRTHSISTQKW